MNEGLKKSVFAFPNAVLGSKVYTGMRLIGSPSKLFWVEVF